MTLLAVAEAQARLLALAQPLAIEEVPLGQAAGRWAAADVSAHRTQPAADLSAMDGYALRFGDLGGTLTVVGESAAGAPFSRPLAIGEAARIYTGAAMPEGADTVLIQEEAARDGDRLTLAGEGPPHIGAHIRPRGSDFRAGEVVIRAGEHITPARLALAAMAGHGTLPVRRRVRIAILATGDELVPPGTPDALDRLPASNGVMVTALLAGLPVEIAPERIVPDDLTALAAAFAEASAWADIVVTTGGASVGDRDLVRPALIAAGAEIDFWRIAMKPGKPLLAGRLGQAIMLGLPGNPVSAFTTTLLFLAPIVAHLSGAAEPLPRALPATAGAALPPTQVRAEYLRARLQDGRVVPVRTQDSAALAALASADCLIRRPAQVDGVAEGDSVEILLLA